jgi:uncharacterized protein YndB with AHSA1/START domain
MAVGVPEPRLPPQPRHVGWRLIELDPCCGQAFVRAVEVFVLEVHDHLFGSRDLVDELDRERAVSFGTFETQVVGILDDQRETQCSIERFGAVEVCRADGHLVEAHAFIPSCRSVTRRSASPSVSLVRSIVVTIRIGVSPARVWRALTIPSEVQAWSGVTTCDVPEGYPAAGQHARWFSKVGPVRLVLHDRVRVVDRATRLAASIAVGFVRIEEEYRLEPQGPGSELVSANEVRSSVLGLGWLAAWLTRADVEASMQRLKEFCERPE